MATETKKRGPAKRWPRSEMINAGIAHIEQTGELPTPSAWKYGSVANPTHSYVAAEYGKNGWSTFLTTLRREYKRRTGNEAPQRVKPGRKPGQGVRESRYAAGPGTVRTLPIRNKNGELPGVAKTEVPVVPEISEPVEPVKKNWFARLFGR